MAYNDHAREAFDEKDWDDPADEWVTCPHCGCEGAGFAQSGYACYLVCPDCGEVRRVYGE